jgi:ABC-2 type transport system permease protein
VRAYYAIFSARFRTLLQYRAAAFAGFGTQLFWGLIRVMILTAFYRSSTAEQPMSLEQTVTYIWLGQAFFAMLPFNVGPDIRQLVREGTVAYDLLRPIDLYGFWYMRALALRTAPPLLRSIPIFILAGLFFGMQPPDSFASGVAWVFAMAGAIILGVAMSTLINISVLWTISGEGISRLITALFFIFGGMIVPLMLFPDWAQKILLLLPFSGIIDTPFRIYMGIIPPEGIAWVLAHQLLWSLVFVLTGRYMVSRATRILTIQGG